MQGVVNYYVATLKPNFREKQLISRLPQNNSFLRYIDI